MKLGDEELVYERLIHEITEGRSGYVTLDCDLLHKGDTFYEGNGLNSTEKCCLVVKDNLHENYFTVLVEDELAERAAMYWKIKQNKHSNIEVRNGIVAGWLDNDMKNEGATFIHADYIWFDVERKDAPDYRKMGQEED